MVAQWRSCGGLMEELWWLNGGVVVAQWRSCCGSTFKMWWLMARDELAHAKRCGGSVEGHQYLTGIAEAAIQGLNLSIFHDKSPL